MVRSPPAAPPPQVLYVGGFGLIRESKFKVPNPPMMPVKAGHVSPLQ